MIDSDEYKELKELIRLKEHCAAFIGAGCSAVLKIPLWKELLIELNEKFGYYKDKNELEQAIKKEDYPKVASNIRSKAADKNVYTEIVSKYSKPRSCYFTSLHLEIINLFKTIVTTNYDRSFEKAYDSISRFDRSLEYKSFTVGKLSHIGIGMVNHVYHIHGDNEQEDFILTYESYKEQYDNPQSQVSSLITTIFNEFKVVFIGFSFNDEFFVSFLENTVRNIKEERTRNKVKEELNYYCIMSDNIKKDFLKANEILSNNITVKSLIDESILIEDQSLDSLESKFRFTNNAVETINNSKQLSNIQKEFLLEKVDLFETNQKKIELLANLNIKVITFSNENYLEIEDILTSLKEEIKAEDSYSPQL